MLLKLDRLVNRYGMKINGVVHVGANTGQEANDYYKLGIKRGVFFEPCEDSYKELVKYLKLFNADYTPFKTALGSVSGEVIINKTKVNNGQSSSILQPKKHLEYYPDITFEETEQVFISTLDAFVFDGYNFLAMDCQGFELEVLKGATETLKNIDFIMTEINTEELYENCAMVGDIDKYLDGFRRVETKMTRHGWGDAFFIRKRLL